MLLSRQGQRLTLIPRCVERKTCTQSGTTQRRIGALDNA
jgi:hypothetical protein